MQLNAKALMEKAQKATAESTKKRLARIGRHRADTPGHAGEGGCTTLKATLTRFAITLDSYSIIKSRKITRELREYLANVGPSATSAVKTDKPPLVKVNLLR
jgi:hypothetical protein